MEINSDQHKVPAVKLNMFVLICCKQGCLSLDLNGKEYCLQPNEFLHCNPGDHINRQEAHAVFSGYVLFISRKAVQDCDPMNTGVKELFFSLGISPIIRLTDSEMDMFHRYAELISVRANIDRPYCKEIVGSLIRAFLFELMACIQAHTSSKVLHCQQISQKDILFKQFIDLISSQKVKPRAVSWYSDKLFVTSKHLSSVCKAVSQCTAFEWINEYVLIDIRQQLKYSEKSIKEIAEYLGFPGVSFFGKYLRKHVGYSPVAYRRHLREE